MTNRNRAREGQQMRTRTTVGKAMVALFGMAASLMVPVAAPSPVTAHTGFTSITDSDGADHTVSGINGTTMKVRVLRPSSGKPATGWPLVIYMAGDFKNRCGNANERVGTQASWYTRKAMAEHGFAVLSFNARGMPTTTEAGVNPSSSTTTGCNALDDAKDTINDSGWDDGGPVDRQDIDDLIEWAVANYAPAGCSSPCIDGDKVGLFGVGADARKALHMGVPPATNPQHNSRVDAIVAVGYEEIAVRNVKDVSNDGALTPAFRPVDQGHATYYNDLDLGNWSHADPSVLANRTGLVGAAYLNQAVPSSVTSWFDDRTILDDNATVDKAQEIQKPVFLANAFLDGEAGTTTATLTYNKLGSTNKYLYLGACGSTYGQLSSSQAGPCQTTNATNLRDRVHAFLDRWVRNDTTVTVGGPVWWAVPPATNPLGTDSWAVSQSAQWPPVTDPGVPRTVTTVTYCLDSTGEWLNGACSTVLNWPGPDTQDTGDRTITNDSDSSPGLTYCVGETYGTAESVSYTSDTDPANDYKMIGFEADVSIASNTTRLQVYADVFTVDSSGVETRVSQGTAQFLPVKRDATAGTVYRFKWKPTGAAWTLKAGHAIRVKIAANYKKAFAQELLPGTYTIKHNDTNPTHFTITFVS